MNRESKPERELERIFDKLADSVMSLPDQEIAAEIAAQGLDPDAEAERIRALVRKLSKDSRQSKLVSAREEYRRQIAALHRKEYEIPQEPAKRRQLLITVLARRPDMRTAITAHFRDFSELTDDDVETALKHLAELGLL